MTNLDFYSSWDQRTSCEYCHRRIKHKEDKTVFILGDDLYYLGARLRSQACLKKFLTITIEKSHSAPLLSIDRCKGPAYQCHKCGHKINYGVCVSQSGFTSIPIGWYCSYECLKQIYCFC